MLLLFESYFPNWLVLRSYVGRVFRTLLTFWSLGVAGLLGMRFGSNADGGGLLEYSLSLSLFGTMIVVMMGSVQLLRATGPVRGMNYELLSSQR